LRMDSAETPIEIAMNLGRSVHIFRTKPSHMVSSCLFLSLQLFDIPEIPYHSPIYREFLDIYIYIIPVFVAEIHHFLSMNPACR
jgi:hypothetical protein